MISATRMLGASWCRHSATGSHLYPRACWRMQLRSELDPSAKFPAVGCTFTIPSGGYSLLLGAGYAWILGIGQHGGHSRIGGRILAAWHGFGAALALDEFALWLKLQNDQFGKSDYWRGEGK